jgi:hypothetical protein
MVMVALLQLRAASGELQAASRDVIALCRRCRRLRSFDLENQRQKIAAFGSAYRRSPKH